MSMPIVFSVFYISSTQRKWERKRKLMMAWKRKGENKERGWHEWAFSLQMWNNKAFAPFSTKNRILTYINLIRHYSVSSGVISSVCTVQVEVKGSVMCGLVCTRKNPASCDVFAMTHQNPSWSCWTHQQVNSKAVPIWPQRRTGFI